jgi:hypothetical protein
MVLSGEGGSSSNMWRSSRKLYATSRGQEDSRPQRVRVSDAKLGRGHRNPFEAQSYRLLGIILVVEVVINISSSPEAEKVRAGLTLLTING